MGKSAIISGIGLIVFGIYLFFTILKDSLSSYITPLVIIIFGIALIIFWRSEDVIEKRKDNEN
jgi:predicted metal-binding membrane protein